ncbi:unnamed protein product [Arabidopsis halleri]
MEEDEASMQQLIEYRSPISVINCQGSDAVENRLRSNSEASLGFDSRKLEDRFLIVASMEERMELTERNC